MKITQRDIIKEIANGDKQIERKIIIFSYKESIFSFLQGFSVFISMISIACFFAACFDFGATSNTSLDDIVNVMILFTKTFLIGIVGYWLFRFLEIIADKILKFIYKIN